MLSSHQWRWGIDQWVAYLKDKEIPVLPRTQSIFKALLEQTPEEKEALSARDLVQYVHSDPFFALKLLRKAERRRSSRLGQETTTALASIMQTGVVELLHIVRDSAVCESEHTGFQDCEFRATIAASVSHSWAGQRADLSPDEVTLSALLSEIGELLLWHFATELPLKAELEMSSGRAIRTVQAQQQAVGFSFRQLTLALCNAWELPSLIGQLIKGTDSPRANIARVAIDAARHIVSDERNPAIPSDVMNIHHVLPGISFEHLLAPLPIPEEYKLEVLASLLCGDETVPEKFKVAEASVEPGTHAEVVVNHVH
jgi:HD-like signal output (HDOD) protein